MEEMNLSKKEFDEEILLDELAEESNYQSINDPKTGIEKDLEDGIIQIIHNDYLMDLSTKLEVSQMLNNNMKIIVKFKDFLEEECHLSLIEWVLVELKSLSQTDSSDLFDKVGALIKLTFNIFNILYYLQINVSDIIHLKLYEKLLYIKSYLIKYNFDKSLVFSAKNILAKWKQLVESVKEVSEISTESSFLCTASQGKIFKIKKPKPHVQFKLENNKITSFYKDTKVSEFI